MQSGDGAALDVLFTRFGGPLLLLATRLTGSHADAEDVVQDVFVGLDRALRHYEERGQLGAWLKRITARTALQAMRRRNQRNEPFNPREHDRAIAASSPPERLVLDEAILRLPATLRAVFTLREIEGYTHDEIAALLDIRVGASKVRLHRAIRQLREFLRNDP